MKNYLSVLALATRNTLFKILGVILIMMIAEIGIFYVSISRYEVLPMLETLIQSSGIKSVFILAFVFSTSSAVLFGTKKCNSKYWYTLQRLSVKDTQISIILALYVMFCTMLIWAAQIVTSLIICKIYIGANTADPYGPVEFLAFYRSSFFHGILPLEDPAGHVYKFILFICIGIGLAAMELSLRHGKAYWVSTVIILVAVVQINTNLFMLGFILFCTGYCIYHIFKGRFAFGEEPEPESKPSEAPQLKGGLQ